MSWGYTVTNGPATWPQLFPQAAGERQSPVDIITTRTQQGRDLKAKPLKWKYVQENAKSLVNPGYCWRVDVKGQGSELTGGPLGDDIYVIEQFHCHWGCNDQEGSEHTVDGKSYAGELHLVHWNSTKYASFQEAAGKSDGLAVLGVFVKVGKHHGELEKVSKLLPFVQHKGDRVTFIDSLDPAKLLPKTYGYWTYLGSLTTPPCTESVTWIVFKEAIELSEQQLNHFRELRCYDVNEECPCDELKGKVIQNYRPPLPLGNRELREYGGH